MIYEPIKSNLVFPAFLLALALLAHWVEAPPVLDQTSHAAPWNRTSAHQHSVQSQTRLQGQPEADPPSVVVGGSPVYHPLLGTLGVRCRTPPLLHLSPEDHPLQSSASFSGILEESFYLAPVSCWPDAYFPCPLWTPALPVCTHHYMTFLLVLGSLFPL